MPRKETPRNPWFWTVLTLLHERSMHPYEIQQLTAQRRKDLLTEHKTGSLYSVIDRLSREGLIAPVATNRAGNLPERTVYRITAAGRERLLGWLRDELGELDRRDLPRFAFALEKAAHLDPVAVRKLLERRVGALEAQVAEFDEIERYRASNDLQRVSFLEIEYAHAVRRAELDWLRQVAGDLAAGSLDWAVVAAPAQDAP
ncbi:PadR family transcriptional regulator [Lentzea sp. NPDC005914]|uniref:PadR family transcriptional regulator n=1 Tax=Lentzea sp. NPDC005914 TaxID=3154572 RepID=UPI00340FD199